MVEIIDDLGHDILPLQRAFDEECAVDERLKNLKNCGREETMYSKASAILVIECRHCRTSRVANIFEHHRLSRRLVD